MCTNFGYYIFCIVAIAVGFFIVKKVTGCIIKAVILFVILLALGVAYYYLQGRC